MIIKERRTSAVRGLLSLKGFLVTAGEVVETSEAAAAAGTSAATAGTLVVAAGTLAAMAGTLVVAAETSAAAVGTSVAAAGTSEEDVEDPATTGAPASTPSASADLATRESTARRVRLCPYHSYYS